MGPVTPDRRADACARCERSVVGEEHAWKEAAPMSGENSPSNRVLVQSSQLSVPKRAMTPSCMRGGNRRSRWIGRGTGSTGSITRGFGVLTCARRVGSHRNHWGWWGRSVAGWMLAARMPRSAVRGRPDPARRWGSSRRHAPTGSMLTAANLRSGRLASARSASNCSPAGVEASAITVHLRRKNRTRRNSQGIATNKDRRRRDGERQHQASQLGGAVQALPGARDVEGGLTGRAQRFGQRVAHQGNVVGTVTGGVRGCRRPRWPRPRPACRPRRWWSRRSAPPCRRAPR